MPILFITAENLGRKERLKDPNGRFLLPLLLAPPVGLVIIRCNSYIILYVIFARLLQTSLNIGFMRIQATHTELSNGFFE